MIFKTAKHPDHTVGKGMQVSDIALPLMKVYKAAYNTANHCGGGVITACAAIRLRRR